MFADDTSLMIDLCNYCVIKVSYIFIKGEKTVKGDNKANRRKRKLTFKNDAPFKSCLSKINSTFVDNTIGSWYCYADVKYVRI